MPRACAEPGRRGVRRTGAGARPGNMNALKHGRNSQLVQTLLAALAAHPTTREALIRMARRQRARQREAEHTAAVLLRQLLNRALVSLKDDQTAEQRANTERLLSVILSGKRSDIVSAELNSIKEEVRLLGP
jgi:hypothetical protein